MLPENVLLEIFDLYRTTNQVYPSVGVWRWHRLVHVCRRWRHIVFASPHRLDLKIHCAFRTVRMDLGIWPAFPIIIDCGPFNFETGIDNLVATLEHSDRVCHINIAIEGYMLGRMAKAMEKPFPVLTHLEIRSHNRIAQALPAGFLGGSAPCLEKIHLRSIAFPALTTLLLSASDLVTLELHKIPPSGYISPEAMVVGLAALHKLEIFVIEFQLAPPRSDRINPSPPPTTRTVLPSLTFFQFRGASEYLEGLVARIDAPQLNKIAIDFLNQLVDFQVAQLSKFIDRSAGLELPLFRHAHLTFSNDGVAFVMSHAPRVMDYLPGHPITLISCQGIDWQVSHLAQVLSKFSATLSNVIYLDLSVDPHNLRLKGTDDVEWLHLLHQFPTVQTLRVHRRQLAERIALALEDITEEMVSGVLRSLDSISLAGQPASSVKKFIALRQISGRPVTVKNT